MIKIIVVDDLGEKSVDIENPGDTTVLSLLNDHSIEIPYGCQSTSCGVCRVKVLDGSDLLQEARSVENDVLDLGTEDNSQRLACTAVFKAGASGTLKIQALN